MTVNRYYIICLSPTVHGSRPMAHAIVSHCALIKLCQDLRGPWLSFLVLWIRQTSHRTTAPHGELRDGRWTMGDARWKMGDLGKRFPGSCPLWCSAAHAATATTASDHDAPDLARILAAPRSLLFIRWQIALISQHVDWAHTRQHC